MQCQRSHFCSVDVCIWMPRLIVVATVSESDCCNYYATLVFENSEGGKLILDQKKKGRECERDNVLGNVIIFK